MLAAEDAISPAWEGEKDGVKEVHWVRIENAQV